MRTYPYLIRSGVSGTTVQVCVYRIKGECSRHWKVAIEDDDEVIGHTARGSNDDRWEPVVYLPDGTHLPLENARSQRDAMGDILQYLSDHKDWRLDLEWREAVA